MVIGVSAQSTADAEAQRAAQAAWAAARALAPVGGAVEALGPVNARLQEIERLRAAAARTSSIDGARLVWALSYADASVRAAIAAAQDERDEMKLFLGQARDLDRRLAGLSGSASWPLPIDELEGELWLEVDRYGEAREAYHRAASQPGNTHAWLGLARVHDRVGDVLAACDAYRRALTGSLKEPEKEEAMVFLNSERCRMPVAGARDQ